MRSVAFLRGLCVASLFIGVVAPAHALIARVWVSGHGIDAPGCATPTNPCRTFQYVLTNIVSPGGEIDVLDPAGYGPMVITQPISVVNNSGPAVVQASAGDAIAVNAPGGAAILLKGLEVFGLDTATNGLHFVSGGRLTVESCSFRHFVNDGALISSGGALSLHMVDFSASDNGQNGVEIAAGAVVKGRIDNGGMDNNGAGGILFTGNNADILVSGDGFTGNTTGVLTSGSGSNRVIISRIGAIGNGTGVSSTGGTSLFTFSNNAITGNTTNVFGLLNPIPGL